MLAVLQYKPGDKLIIEDVPIPKPGPGEVLIKMQFAPVNPSDLSMLRGTYAHPPSYPFTPGIEGSGLVTRAGKGIIPRLRLNKMVACSSTAGMGGTWAEYMVTSAMKTIPLGSKIEPDQGSMLIVNPMTAVGILTFAKKCHHQAIVNNAAASSLGRMLEKLCNKNNIGIINIVRRKEHEEELEKTGSSNVLNSEDKDFANKLKNLATKLKATLFLDAIGGNQTRILTESAPQGSTILSYAKLSEEDISIDPRTLMQGNKSIAGFALANWTNQRSIWKKLGDIRLVKSLLNNQLKSKIAHRYDLSDINKAIENYKNNMSGGKVLIKM